MKFKTVHVGDEARRIIGDCLEEGEDPEVIAQNYISLAGWILREWEEWDEGN